MVGLTDYLTNDVHIAVLMTCHNRCELTARCLRSVLKAAEAFEFSDKLHLCFFVTNDDCKDATVETAKSIVPPQELIIINADGNAFWAGGMRIAWKEALKTGKWDYFLLLNDDTEVWTNLFDELFEADYYSVKTFGCGGIYSGNTTEFGDRSKITFGGKVGKGFFPKRYVRLSPSGNPEKCDIVNANILMVSNNVVEKIGIFPDYYKHGAADNDYGFRSNHAGLPVLITSGFCGSCDADNYDFQEELFKLKNWSLCKRYKYLSFPVHSAHDQLLLSLRWRPLFVPLFIIRQLSLFLIPGILYWFNKRKCEIN